jgi:hypothetical protein
MARNMLAVKRLSRQLSSITTIQPQGECEHGMIEATQDAKHISTTIDGSDAEEVSVIVLKVELPYASTKGRVHPQPRGTSNTQCDPTIAGGVL